MYYGAHINYAVNIKIHQMDIMYMHVNSTKHYKITCMRIVSVNNSATYAWVHTESTYSSYPGIGGKVSYHRHLLNKVRKVFAILITFTVLSFASAVFLITSYSKKIAGVHGHLSIMTRFLRIQCSNFMVMLTCRIHKA